MNDPLFFRKEQADTPYDSEEFEAGYSARLTGQPQYITATSGWRAGWIDAEYSLVCRNAGDLAWVAYCGMGLPAGRH